MSELTVQAPAKVNFGLNIVGKREDGYHLIETIFQEVDFGDTVHFEECKAGCTIECDHPAVPANEHNLCCKAYHNLKEICPELPGIHIKLDKSIPVGAGLGGGSSDAAATLIGLYHLFQPDIQVDQLYSIATRVGADVPFFLTGGTAYARGIGDELEPIEPLTGGYILIAVPDIHISTAWAYKNVNYTLTSNKFKNKLKGFFEIEGNLQRLQNDFEPLVIKEYSEIDEIKQQLTHFHAEYVSLSGSGSAVFGVFPERAMAEKALGKLSQSTFSVLTYPVRRESPRIDRSPGTI
jgi:4-diphosphocytidyl-2-C-methyl-D-erythritol kinase